MRPRPWCEGSVEHSLDAEPGGVRIGAAFQLLLEPKPREPTKHQYDYDAQTVIGFLRQFNLEHDFKVRFVRRCGGMLGSVTRR